MSDDKSEKQGDIARYRQIEQQLLDEKSRSQAICEHAPFGIMLVEKEGAIRYVNPKFRQLFGYDLADIPDIRTWSEKTLTETQNRQESSGTWLKVILDGALEKQAPTTTQVTSKDGTQRIITFAASDLSPGELMISCEDVTELKNQERKLLYITTTDALTGLPNRSSLEKAVASAIDHAKQGKVRGSRSALLFLDIDGFNQVNNEFGHTAGDEVLIGLTKALKNILRTGDFAYRFGGDQFAVVFRNISMAEAQLAAERIQKTVNQNAFKIDYRAVRLDMAMGLIQIDGRMDMVTLLSNAAKAMRKAKSKGRNQLAVHESSVSIIPNTGKG
jgi:diguanylate cyclase (GGDEF)-like protein/PAS domain S-box-containing protein